MSLSARLDRLIAWQRAEAGRFAQSVEDRLVARGRLHPSPDLTTAEALMVEWCGADPTLDHA